MPNPFRSLSPSAVLGLVLAPLIILAAVAGPLSKGSPPLFHAVVIAVTAVSVVLSFIWWSKLDEIDKEAHKFAWFWGGSSALGLVAVSIVPLWLSRDLGRFVHELGAGLADVYPGAGGFIVGVVACALAQFLGYAIVYVVWWAKRMRPR